MNLITILIIAVALAMDAFSVSISLGIHGKHNRKKVALQVATMFGLFQAIMPLLGYFLGNLFSSKLYNYNNIVAFILLGLIGLNMIREWYKKLSGSDVLNDGTCEIEPSMTTKFSRILLLAIATSIDALSVGFSFSLIKVNIYLSIIVIGIVTFILSYIGTLIGCSIGYKFKHAELFGGLVLIGIGFEILVRL
ncbi:MAG: manganese efflux pump [Spirochaetaceae bacterium]|nr:manganese efflux pump [Spirochaetaceae bacterium]